MIKKLILTVLAAGACICAALDEFDPHSPRAIKVGEKPVISLAENGKPLFEIVAGPALSAQFAAEELATVLEKALESKPPVVKKASGDKPAILVGVRQAEGLDADGYIIQTDGGNVHIYGKDSPKGRLLKDTFSYRDAPDRGTLNGVYEFLERFAGVNFFFPGEIGTIIPKLKDWKVPEINITDRPDFKIRRYTKPEDCKSYESWLRWSFQLRSGTTQIPNCHGLAFLGYLQRFKKTHPEYFALMDNGLRHYDENAARKSSRNGQFCFSSGIREEIVKDAISFLKGEPASVRGVCLSNGKIAWSHSRFPVGMPYFNIMPNDSYYPCRCEKCRPHYDNGPQEKSNFTWAFFNEVAQKVKSAGVKGYLTTMAYDGYSLVPDMPVEDNILVMLALRGPWNSRNEAIMKRDIGLLQAWNKKINRKLWLWTYPAKLRMGLHGIPNVAPHAVYDFFKRSQPWIFGAYLEAETDRSEFSYLNFYVFSRFAWDNSRSLEDILSSYYKTMFGPAADSMRLFDEALEDRWMKIVSSYVETDEGPVVVPPTIHVVWNELYSPEFLAKQDALLKKAEAALKNSPDELKRVHFYRQKYHDAIIEQRKAWQAENSSQDHWKAYMPSRLALIPIEAKAEVMTYVSISDEGDKWRFAFECEEPYMDKIPQVNRPHDDKNVWADGCVTVFLDPLCTREDFYQIEVSPFGTVTDLQHKNGINNYAWESKAVVNCSREPGKGWKADVLIPKSSIEAPSSNGMGMNFMRYRVIPGLNVKTTMYQWNPSGKRPHTPAFWGRLMLGEKEPASLIREGDFACKYQEGTRFLGKSCWYADKGRQMHVDKTDFITGGQSICILPGEMVVQYLNGLKSKTKYRLSFYAKLEGIESDKSGFYIRFHEGNDYVTIWPKPAMKGSIPWRRYETIIETNENVGGKNKAYMRFVLNAKAGKVWVDHALLEEIQ